MLEPFLQFFYIPNVLFSEFGKIFLFHQHTTMGSQNKVYCRSHWYVVQVGLDVWGKETFSVVYSTV